MNHFGSFEPASNAADWAEAISVTDADTGTSWPLATCLIELELRDQDGARRLHGSTADGALTLTPTGFEFAFPAASMRGLSAGSYTVNIRFTDSATGFVAEPVIAELPVLEGGFR
ncbi:hypothetical protein AB4099_31620 [Bosea sp. 2KB_26]|uniref:hypothetical protein n=1 Tax=Bosea sp. 2KB_26 TaxID=3237475 RepID=UPI000DE1BC96